MSVNLFSHGAHAHPIARAARRGRVLLSLLAVLGTLVPTLPAQPVYAQPVQPVPAQSDPCATAPNPIACENAKLGNDQTEWDTQGSGDAAIQGYATDMSVNKGTTVHFKVNTPATAYRLDVYRLGYYGGLGARKVATVL